MVKKNNRKAKVTIKAKEKKWKYDPSLKGLFKFWWKTFVIAFFILYLVVGYTGTLLWAKVVAHRSLKIENLAVRVQDYRKRGKYINSLFTVYVQKYNKSEEVIEQLLPIMPNVESIMFFEMARRYAIIGDFKQSLFWHMLGSVAGRYDNLRCEGIKDNKFLDIFTKNATSPYLILYLQNNENAIKDTEKKALEWIKKHRLNGRPEYFCAIAKLYYDDDKVTGKAVPSILWPSIFDKVISDIEKNIGKEEKKDIEEVK